MDRVMGDAARTATIVPPDRFACMEGARARLHCDVAWASLDLEGRARTGEGEERKLKEAAEAAKKALEIYDELIRGPKILRDGGDEDDRTDDGDSSRDRESEFERILGDDPFDGEADAVDDVTPLWLDYHRGESAWALGLVASCYARAGAAVTAEGLFQSALDASSSFPFGQNLSAVKDAGGGAVERGVCRSSPSLGLIARDVRLWYASLCDGWEKRKGDADRLRRAAAMIEKEGVLKGFATDEDVELGGETEAGEKR